jgi:XTP/dITP diphosphohydrolase
MHGLRRLLIATTNAGKVREIRRVLVDVDVALVTLDEVAPTLAAPDETGRTFADNAALKAEYYAQRLGLPTVAEDSGLSIDALGGRPGVESARYPGATYADKFARLYAELSGTPRPWTAHFTAALAFVGTSGTRIPEVFTPEIFVSEVQGEIASKPLGAHGFGYDPVFFFPPFGCTTGEMTDEQKLGISHRGQVFRRFRDRLKSP